MKASLAGVGAFISVLLLTGTASAQYPTAPGYSQPCQAAAYPGNTNPIWGQPGACVPTSECKDGCKSGHITKCVGKVVHCFQSCFCKHHAMQGPVFPTHPFTRSPRDYFMLD